MKTNFLFIRTAIWNACWLCWVKKFPNLKVDFLYTKYLWVGRHFLDFCTQCDSVRPLKIENRCCILVPLVGCLFGKSSSFHLKVFASTGGWGWNRGLRPLVEALAASFSSITSASENQTLKVAEPQRHSRKLIYYWTKTGILRRIA